MSDPVQPCSTMVEWHVFRIPMDITYVQRKDSQGRALPGTRPVYVDKPGLHDWMKTNIRGKWSWGATTGRDRPYFIQNAQDAMLFKLTWYDSTVKAVFANG